MSMPDVVIDVLPRNAVRAFTRLAETLSAGSLAYWLENEMLPWIQERAGRRFATEGDDAVGKWSPLAASTIEIRQTKGFPAGPINHRTGELEDFITGSGADIVPFGVNAVKMSYPADIGISETLYSKLTTAQKGSQQPGYKDTPPRPVLALSESDAVYARVSLLKYIMLAQGMA